MFGIRARVVKRCGHEDVAARPNAVLYVVLTVRLRLEPPAPVICASYAWRIPKALTSHILDSAPLIATWNTQDDVTARHRADGATASVALASEQLMRCLQRLRKAQPIVVQQGARFTQDWRTYGAQRSAPLDWTACGHRRNW